MEPTFSELLRRLPSAERTNKNKVLLALLALGAVEKAKALESAAVIEQIKLSLGRKAVPKNVADVLRKASPDVDCARAGLRELKWYLTASGLAALKTLTGVELSAKNTGNGYDYDLAIVCALHTPELTSILSAFGGATAWSAAPSAGQAHNYQVCEAKTSGGRSIRVVAGAPTYMGLTATAILSTQMLLLFKPRMIAVVGIAAGTKSAGRGYGDILVADPSVDYASGKVSYSDGAESFHPDPFPLPIDTRLRTLVQEDIRTRDGLDEIAESWSGTRPPTLLKVHIGPLGAADQVVDSEKRVAEVQRNWRKLIGIEMEMYAAYRSAHEAPTPRPLHIGFKAVCDFAASKSDAWQTYAAHTAAGYARRFLLKNWDRPSLGLAEP